MMRLRTLAMILATTSVVLLAMCLSGCGLLSGDTPASTPTLGPDEQQQMAADCMNLWLNTEAPQDMIEQGMDITDQNGNSAVTQDASGTYSAHPGTGAYAAWTGVEGNPASDIWDAIIAGWGCPYDPVVKVKMEQAEQECLDIWANNEPPQAAIDAGLETTLPDGTSVLPVITRDASGAYHVDIAADGFQTWIGSKDYYVPWDHIKSLTKFGDACPYGPSPEDTPSATAR